MLYQSTRVLQRPACQIKAVPGRLRMLGNLMQQRLWSVMIVHNVLPSRSYISISGDLFPILDKLLTMYSRHRKHHDRPLKCKIGECRQGFAFNRDLERHVASKHPEATSQGRYYCHHSNCDRAMTGLRGGFPRKDTLMRHLKTHRNREETGHDTQ